MVKVRPNDKDAKSKFNECNKIVRMQAFQKAIAVDSDRSVADAIDLDGMSKWYGDTVSGLQCLIYMYGPRFSRYWFPAFL